MSRRTRLNFVCLAIAGVLLGAAGTARATWSIVLVDTETNEIAFGSATCLTGFDLANGLAVLRVDVGAGAAQSFVDTTGTNRHIIRDQLVNGTAPADIIDLLSQVDPSHETRQYGIVDVLGRAAGFTGQQAGTYKEDITGQVGSIVYAIQGNVLTGPPVIDEAELAVVNTPGDLTQKLMAGMEAARSMGGDGRCSCSPSDPEGCGSPPPNFTKSAHVGFMYASRTGDTDGGCGSTGCAEGDYFMQLDVAFQSVADEDPVLQLQTMYDDFRASLVGRPDGLQSTAEVEAPFHNPPLLITRMLIDVRDLDGTEVDPANITVNVSHHESSAGISLITDPISLGGGQWLVNLVSMGQIGLDRFNVVLEDGGRPVTVSPRPEFWTTPQGDIDLDGDVDLTDMAAFVGCLSGPGGGINPNCNRADNNHDDDVDLADFMQVSIDYPD